MIRPRLPVILSDEALDKMHQSALRILKKTGIQLPYPELRKKLAFFEGVQCRGDRVCFDENLADRQVKEYVEGCRKDKPSAELVPDGAILLNAGSHAHHIVDCDSGVASPLTCADLIAATRLVDALYDKGVRGTTPGLPQDVPLLAQQLMQYKIGCEYSRHCGGVAVGTTGRPLGLITCWK